MSVRKEIYEILSNKLNTLNYFQIIDIYKGQFNDENANNINVFPAVYISIGNISYEEAVLDFVEGVAQVDVFVFFKKFEDTSVGANNQADSLAILSIMDTIVDELQGSYGSFFTELSQVSEEDLSFTYGKPVFKVSFSTNIIKKVEGVNYILN